MGRYVARRLLQFVPVLLGTVFLLHYLQTISIQINGDPIRALFGDRQPPEDTLDAIRRAFGLDNPCLTQPGNPCLDMFVTRLGDYASGDFGVDFTLQPITSLLADAVPITLRLTVIAVVFESLVGIFCGVVSALRANGSAPALEDDGFWVPERDGQRRVPIDAIDWIEETANDEGLAD